MKERTRESEGSRNVHCDAIHANYFNILFRRSKFRKEKS